MPAASAASGARANRCGRWRPMLKQRVITGAVIGLVVVCSILLLPAWAFAGLALVVIAGLGGWEWARLTGIDARSARLAFVAATLGLALLGGWFMHERPGPWVLVPGLLWWAVVLVILAVHDPGEGAGRRWRLILRVAGPL